MTTTHTSLPWHWGKDWDTFVLSAVDEYNGDKYADLTLRGADGTDIIDLRIDHYKPEWDVDEEISQPNAANRRLIVTSVNNHGKMLEALHMSIEIMRYSPHQQAQDVIKKARAVIAQIEGE